MAHRGDSRDEGKEKWVRGLGTALLEKGSEQGGLRDLCSPTSFYSPSQKASSTQ